MTGGDLIAAALRAAGIAGAGEAIDANDQADAQVVLNHFLESLGAERLGIFTLTRSTFNLVAGTASYTLGTGGNFNITRPAKIEYVSYVYNANPSQPLERRIKMYSDPDWADIPVKAITNVLPEGVYDDGGFPSRTLTYWPVPNDSSVQTIIGAWQPLTQFTDLTTDNKFPPGYIEAIKYNLAIRMAAEFGKNINPAIALFAKEGLARIKSANVPDIEWKIDPALRADGGRYDWRVDDYR